MAVGGGSIWLIRNVSEGDQSPAAASGRSLTADSPSAASSAAAALSSCREQVDRADAVMAAGRTGIDHWNQHVQAQTDALAGRIDDDELATILRETREPGKHDVDAWHRARDAWKDDPAACSGVTGLSPADAAALGSCGRRLNALRAALPPAAAAMTDWSNHLSSMTLEQQLGDSREDWLAEWKTAPDHIEAWQKADEELTGAPSCPE
ncbi:hypothetical protein SAMN04489812_0507 [Microlunatus soli]|uniref:Uncharacterized protein n=2 Tax=Microlunatus soli TaxID=630515 RepID=A0A1H1NGC6_9ACTN|nr:hypothetical protein SAMN04489812_0507 [Microlunatus soli]